MRRAGRGESRRRRLRLADTRIQLLGELGAGSGVLIVRHLSELPNCARLEALGYVTSQSADLAKSVYADQLQRHVGCSAELTNIKV